MSPFSLGVSRDRNPLSASPLLAAELSVFGRLRSDLGRVLQADRQGQPTSHLAADPHSLALHHLVAKNVVVARLGVEAAKVC